MRVYHQSMSKLFIFDMGEVLILDVHTLPQIAKELGLDGKLLKSDWMYYDMPLMDGFMSPNDYYRHLEFAFDIAPIKEDLFYKFFTPKVNDFMLDNVRRLKAAGHRVVVGSNTFYPHWEKKIISYPWITLFDNLYASHVIHISKPLPAFWRYIMRNEGFSASDTVFIDDCFENIESAKKLGIETFQYLRNNDEIDAFFSHYL